MVGKWLHKRVAFIKGASERMRMRLARVVLSRNGLLLPVEVGNKFQPSGELKSVRNTRTPAPVGGPGTSSSASPCPPHSGRADSAAR